MFAQIILVYCGTSWPVWLCDEWYLLLIMMITGGMITQHCY